MAKLLSDVLPILWEEWVVMVGSKGEVLLLARPESRLLSTRLPQWHLGGGLG